MNSFVNHLGLFAKFWEPGRVKTRLAATLGNQQACELYQVFLFHLLESVVSVTERTTVVFSPPEQQADFRAAISADWSLEPQTDGDLGDRMKNFFSQRLPDAGSETAQATKVIAIGADCPQLPAEEIQTAFDLLNENDVVIGPSTDGGYYLLGMKGSLVEVFDDIAWSTPEVLPQTIQRLDQQNKTYALLRERIDVDDQNDLQQMLAGLAPTDNVPQSNQSLAEKVSAVLSKGP